MSTTLYHEFPTHFIAGRIADIARRWGFSVKRSAGGPFGRSAYVYCDGLKIRVADHPQGKRERGLFLDVAVGDRRPGSVSTAHCRQASGAKSKPAEMKIIWTTVYPRSTWPPPGAQ